MKEFIEKLIARFEEISIPIYDSDMKIENKVVCTDVAKNIINQLAKEHKGGWIPCNEKQPSKDGYYLITTSDGEIDVREYDYGNGWGWDGFERIIAWQPIQPYKAEEAQWKRAMLNTFLKR